ncbi:tryptophan synthase subunit alpha [Salinisphaera sp. Q1T1-3]|uniref:tryptophan synthase subunit alpha n=1 Tax=Salinisphaera sp. Q1T1-3 TaxID=2321229 RepID=UPI000E74618A|nr:tryptophan synthase subunit alpha [Salinisphaera sp. Q1T1-3]RJS95028.1 tryptophan synthase subunit alpha [Salinisphaera sp. Q1T1-3]
MNRLDTRFDALRQRGRTALIPYLTAGDPGPDATVGFMHGLVEAGADVIELGVPFTDPMADGPVIQAACERALANGTSLKGVLSMVAQFRERDAETPVVLMGYYNPIDRMGLSTFCEAARNSGVDGVLIVDVTAEEAPEVLPELSAAALSPVCLIAPTTSEARIAKICAHAGGYIYYVSFKGVTGASSLDADRLADQIAPIRTVSALPIGVGFGVRTPTDAAAVSRVADGVVVGSVLVSRIADNLDDPAAATAELRATLGAMRDAIDAADDEQRKIHRQEEGERA